MLKRAVWLLVLVGCGSETAVQERWDDWVAEHNTCDVAEDCAAVFPGCPLGCYEAVNASFEEEADAMVDRLIRRYESAGRSCAYDCIEMPALTCDAGVCGFAE
ncbi:MAG: hypothetical protein KC912_06360 [Proteobacteria bacterium]|nr:hypothetical protein [Pseudomonadota bacterium]